jgi:hypothetical protein
MPTTCVPTGPYLMHAGDRQQEQDPPPPWVSPVVAMGRLGPLGHKLGVIGGSHNCEQRRPGIVLFISHSLHVLHAKIRG